MNDSFYKTPEDAALARHIIGLEEDALKIFLNGDMSAAYLELWSRNRFNCFDAVTNERVKDVRQTACHSLNMVTYPSDLIAC